MARKKKNPLGDFEDALNSLGFSSSEEGGSVTDLDTADSHVGLPDEDIDNLDTPEDTESTEGNEKTEDPAAHEDETEIPDNVLNNTSETTNAEDE